MSVIAPLILAFLTIFAASTYVFTLVIPFELVVDSFEAFDTDQAKWKRNLDDVKKQHAAFASSKGMDTDDAQMLQKLLWRDWPAIAVCTILLLGLAFYVVFKTAGHAVSLWALGIRKRRSAYARGDVASMQNGDFAKTPAAPAS